MLLEVKHTYKGKLEDFALISTESLTRLYRSKKELVLPTNNEYHVCIEYENEENEKKDMLRIKFVWYLTEL